MTPTLDRPSAPAAPASSASPAPAASAAGAAAVSAHPPRRARSRHRVLRAAGWVATAVVGALGLGVGALALGIGGIGALAALSARPLHRALPPAGWVTTVVVGVLALGIGALAALPAFDARLLVVTSGSMAPTIATGDAVVAVETPPEEVAVGDVIAFQGYGRDRLTTHRVISRHEVDGQPHFRTQGDANATPDSDLAPATRVAGKVALTLPKAGRPLMALTHPTARLLLLVLPAAVIAALELRDLWAGRPRDREPPWAPPGTTS